MAIRHQPTKGQDMRKFNKWSLVGLGLGGSAIGAFAADPVVDMTATAASIVADATAAITAGLTIFALVYGARVVIRSFKAVAK